MPNAVYAHGHSRPHFKTFARLECPAIPGAAMSWPTLLSEGDTQILLACEGESLVGAVALRHAPGSAVARLVQLAVCPSARGRGIGTLLVDAAVTAAADNGAAVLVADVPTGSAAMSRLLVAGGFAALEAGAATHRHKLLLWPSCAATPLINLGRI